MVTVSTHNNFIYFTTSLVVLLLVSAINHSFSPDVTNLLSQFLILITFGVAYTTLSFGSRWHLFVGSTMVLLLLANALRGQLPWNAGELLRDVIALVFYATATYYAGRQVLSSHYVELNTIVGALAIYLLLGIAWASLYMIVLFFDPGAFKGIDTISREDSWPAILYFSFVTLATLGYGDITPTIPISRTLAYLEAIAGTFYLAIVVASLVSARRQQANH